MTKKQIKQMNKHMDAKLKGLKIPQKPRSKKQKAISDANYGTREVRAIIYGDQLRNY